MTIKVGDTLPEMKLMTAGPDGPKEESTSSLFGGKTVVLFATPGAFTPTCSAKHLPGFVQHSEAFTDKKVDTIICMAVNDPFVMAAWGRDQGVDGWQRAGLPYSHFLANDNVHMNDLGYRCVADALAESMEAGLGQSQTRIALAHTN